MNQFNSSRASAATTPKPNQTMTELELMIFINDNLFGDGYEFDFENGRIFAIDDEPLRTDYENKMFSLCGWEYKCGF